MEPIRILHLDDNPLDAQLVAMTLEMERKKLPTTVNYVQTKEEYLAALKRKDFDLILSDYHMPGYDGDQALATAQEVYPEIPFIMVTGELSEDLVIETLKRGATDYVLKDRIFRLVPAIKRALEEAAYKRKNRETERALRESEERYRAALANSHFILAQTDTEARYTWIHNPHPEFDVSAILGKRDSELDPTAEAMQLEEAKLRVLRTGNALKEEFAINRSDSLRYYEIVIEPRRDEHGHIIGLTTAGLDITERKRAEGALRQSEARFRSVVENMSEGLMLFDAQGMLYQNPASLQIHGFHDPQQRPIQHKELPATWQGWDESGRPLSFEEWPVARVLRLESFQNQVLRAVGETAREFWASYNGRPILWKDGKLALGFITIRDITEQKQAELDARQAELALRLLNAELEERVRQRTAALERLNKKLESFSYSISHDLKTPLRLIMGFADLLARQTEANLSQEQKDYLATIQQQASHMEELIKALLRFSRFSREGET